MSSSTSGSGPAVRETWLAPLRWQQAPRPSCKGSKWLRGHLVQAASRTKGTYPSVQYARLRGRRGPAKATIAVGHSILVAVHHMLERGVPYEDLGDEWFLRRYDLERHASKLVGQLTALGYDVTITPAQGEAA